MTFVRKNFQAISTSPVSVLSRSLDELLAAPSMLLKRAVRRWQPYAGMVYFYLLLAGLTESGENASGRSAVGA